MTSKIHSIHFTADAKLVDFIERKLSKLETYFESIISTEVFLRLDKASNNENKIVEIKLLIPNNELFSKRECKSFEEAADLTIEALRRQLVKHKGKVKMATL